MPPGPGLGAPPLFRAWDSLVFFLSTAVADLPNAVMVSAILHVVLVFGITHTQVNPALFEPPSPPIDVVLVNGDPNPGRSDLAPYGAGEACHKPLIAAVANAVYDATGVRLRQPPFRSERVLAALQAASKRV